jgi:NAD(P)H-hydrate epimerase
MELAGNGAAREAYRLYKENISLAGDQNTRSEVLVFCGSGNNGGDGLVVARYLNLWQVPVRVWIVSNKSAPVGDPQMSSEEGNANRAIAKHLGVPIEIFNSGAQLDFNNVSLIVDALLGTGLDRTVTGMYKEVIEAINQSGKPVISVDLPSGINSDTGQIMGVAVKAASTVTFGYLKSGLLCYPGFEWAGKTILVDIGLPALSDHKPAIFLTTVQHVVDLLPVRDSDSNKGTFGTVLTIAGSLGMSGATMLSSLSALKVGCGLSLLATPKSLVPHLPPREVIYKPIAETERFSIHPDALPELDNELKRAQAIVLGPGMSTHPQTVNFVQEFVKETLSKLPDTPCLIDADALNAIAKDPSCLSGSPHPFVLTPHPKELSRLTGIDTAEIQKDRIKAALEAAKLFSSVVVLKGANSVIADPEGNVAINPTGNSSMAKAGAGDVLSGIIGGLLAQGLKPFDAAVAGAYIHGRAGDLAAEIQGMSGVLAGDLVDSIPEALITIGVGQTSSFEQNLNNATLAN